MTVSFIVTSYNYAKYIHETIESIKNQTYRDFEIIVVDDFSSDDSVKILEQIDGIKLIKHSKNKGQLASIITGLKEANGEYISIIDSDDTIKPEYTQILIDNIHKYNVALVTCNCKENKLLTLENSPFGGWWWSPMSCGILKKSYLNCILEYQNTDLWKICPDKFIFNLAHLQNNSMTITNNLVDKREHENNAGKIKNRFFINLKNNLIIRHETLKIIPHKKFEIVKSYPYIFKQIFQKIFNYNR